MMSNQRQGLMEKHITSRDNPLFKELRDCLEPRGINKSGMFVLSGRKQALEFIKNHPGEVMYVVLPESFAANQSGGSSAHARTGVSLDPLLESFAALPEQKRSAIKVVRFGKPLFSELDTYGTHYPLIIGRVPPRKLWNEGRPAEGIEILCALNEPSNLGALLRSCAAFKVSRVVLLKESTTPYHPKALRAASGASFEVPIEYGPSIRELDRLPGPIHALDAGGISLNDFRWPKDIRLLLGQEGPGVPNLASLQRLRIDIDPDVESLNATVAASIALYAYRTKHRLA